MDELFYVISSLRKTGFDEHSLCSSNDQVGAVDVEHDIDILLIQQRMNY